MWFTKTKPIFMKPKHAALKATIVVLVIIVYCTLIELSSRETVIKIIMGTIYLAVAFGIWILVFSSAMRKGPYSDD